MNNITNDNFTEDMQGYLFQHRACLVLEILKYLKQACYQGITERHKSTNQCHS